MCDVLSGTWSDGIHYSGVMEEWFGQQWWDKRSVLLLLTTILVFAPLISFKRLEVRQEISPIVMTVISFLIPILQHAEELNKSLIENSATTLGRVAWVCPGVVSPHMVHCLRSF
ncbi:unnamed protein product [Camellia sinensis]